MEKCKCYFIYIYMSKTFAQNYKENIFNVYCSLCAALLWHRRVSSGACLDKLAWVLVH